MSGAPRRPRVLAPRSNPFANDGSARSFTRAGAPVFRHPTQCRGWDPRLPPADNSPASRLPSNLRRVEAQLHALRHTLHNITNDVQVIEICHKSNPICGRNCCLRARPRPENNSRVSIPERWWDAPIDLSKKTESKPSSSRTKKGRDEPSVWWAGVVSPGPPLSPLPPITTTISFAQPSPSTNVSGARASQMQQQSTVLAPPQIREPPTIRPTSLSVSSSSSSSSSQESSAPRGARKGLSPPSSTTSTAFSSPTVSSRSRSIGNDSVTQAPHRLAHSKNSTSSHQDTGHVSSSAQTSQPTTYALNATITQDDSDSGPCSYGGQRDVATLGITASHIPSFPRQHTKAASVQSFSTNTSSSSLPRRRSVSTPASPSSFRRRRQLRARRVLPPTHLQFVTSPTTPDHGTPLQLPPFSPPGTKECAAQPLLPSVELDKENADDEEQERIDDMKRRAELARLLADSKPGKTFHPGSGSTTSASAPMANTTDPTAAETEYFGIGVVIVSLLLVIALFLLHAQLTQLV